MNNKKKSISRDFTYQHPVSWRELSPRPGLLFTTTFKKLSLVWAQYGLLMYRTGSYQSLKREWITTRLTASLVTQLTGKYNKFTMHLPNLQCTYQTYNALTKLTMHLSNTMNMQLRRKWFSVLCKKGDIVKWDFFVSDT